MDHDSLERLKQTHPTWRLLLADNAPLILGFLQLVFSRSDRRAVAAPELTGHLEAYLDQLREGHSLSRYPRAAQEYLDDWASVDRSWLRKYYPRTGEDAEFDLTPAAEKALEWVESLAPRQFVGTESRLLTLFHLLRDLAIGSQEDPAARIEELESRKQALEREIERVKEGRVPPLDATQVKERYLQVADTAKRLLGDFRQVEENFRLLDLQMRERIALSARPKGLLLEEIFGETDHIRRSDQGKSFEAFWEFLMSPARQDDLRNWLHAVHELSAVSGLPEETVMRELLIRLLDAGDKVHGTVVSLVEQLRRFVDDQVHVENRRILDIIRTLENHAVVLRNEPPQRLDFAKLDAPAPEPNLPLCRSLFRPPRRVTLEAGPVPQGDAELDLANLFAQVTIDERLLRNQIADTLRGRTQVTLADVARAFPPRQGLAEVVGYLRIAGHEGAAVDESVIDAVEIPRSGEHAPKLVTLPRIIFTE
jgi:Protein of unknown function (DUF3375)